MGTIGVRAIADHERIAVAQGHAVSGDQHRPVVELEDFGAAAVAGQEGLLVAHGPWTARAQADLGPAVELEDQLRLAVVDDQGLPVEQVLPRVGGRIGVDRGMCLQMGQGDDVCWHGCGEGEIGILDRHAAFAQYVEQVLVVVDPVEFDHVAVGPVPDDISASVLRPGRRVVGDGLELDANLILRCRVGAARSDLVRDDPVVDFGDDVLSVAGVEFPVVTREGRLGRNAGRHVRQAV